MTRLLGHLKSSGDHPAPTDAKLRAARLAVARRSPNLEEIPDDLVRRARRWVSASTDDVFKETRGAVWATGSAELLATHQKLCYIVGEDGTLRFFEREPGTWSEQVAAQARRRMKRVRR